MTATRTLHLAAPYQESAAQGRIILRDGTEIILSRLNRIQLRQQYQDYMFALAREGSL